MGTILGIDTGGTFTDGVLFDGNNKRIIKAAKTATTHDDLMQCIISIVEKLSVEKPEAIEIVSLSTTLVTNACVEKKGIHSKLVLLGANDDTVRKYGHEYGMPDYEDIHFIDCDISMDGDILREPDWDAFRALIEGEENGIQAYAVVQMWGMVNPTLEKKAKAIINELKEVPVICGYELSSKLNFMKRAVSCYLNSRVTPLFREFLVSVDRAMKAHGINAPMVVVRSDAGVMSSVYAGEKPVETLLSGPAASIWGALSLTDADEGIVVDVGGTTSDIAVIENRTVALTELGATVGGYRTATSSVNLTAIGIGGDSDVQMNKYGVLSVGPRRVIPICHMAERYPMIKERLKEIIDQEQKGSQCLGTFYRLKQKTDLLSYKHYLSERESVILSVLDDVPKDLGYICDTTGYSRYEFSMDRLIGYGLVEKSGLTPTDIMHINGDFDRWDMEASDLALTQFAIQYGVKRDQVGEMVLDEAGYQIYRNIVSVLMEHQKLSLNLDEPLLRYAYNNPSGLFAMNLGSKLPLIGIGAPAHVLLPRVASKLKTEFICPEYASTANAVGAAMGEISVHIKVRIIPWESGQGPTQYKVMGMNETRIFDSYEEAEAYALGFAVSSAEEEARKRGARAFEVTHSKKDLKLELAQNNEDEEECAILIESVVNAYARSSIHEYVTQH